MAWIDLWLTLLPHPSPFESQAPWTRGPGCQSGQPPHQRPSDLPVPDTEGDLEAQEGLFSRGVSLLPTLSI